MGKLKLDFTYDYDFILIGIHSTLEDFLLALQLNNVFGIKLRRKEESLNFKNKNGDFSIYDCDNEANFTFWSLISNKQVVEESLEDISFSLFEAVYSTYILIKEKKEIDYFLKIEGNFTTAEKQKIIQKINKIHGVMACVELNPVQIKAIDNLIY